MPERGMRDASAGFAVARPDIALPPMRDVPAPPPPPTNRGPIGDPIAGTRFLVAIDGRDLSVSRVTGLELGAVRSSVRVVAAGPKDAPTWSADPSAGTVLIERAFDGDPTLYAWRRRAASTDADAQRAATVDVTITVLDAAGAPFATFVLRRAWPVVWSGPELDANRAAVALESVDVVYTDLLLR